MQQRWKFRRGAWLLTFAGAVAAATPDFDDEKFALAAGVVMTYDYLADGCAKRGGQPEQARRAIHAWEANNQVALIRQRLADLTHDAPSNAMIERQRTGIRTRMQPVYPHMSCEAAVAAIKLPEAQFAAQSPQLLARLQPVSQPSERAAPSSQRPPRAPSSAAGGASKLAPLIDSFGFDTRMTMGIGGFLTTAVYPIVLFRDGRALREVAALSHADGIAAHQQLRPKDWTRWRRGDGRIQIQDAAGAWKSLAFNVTYAKLPADLRLDGSYRSLSGAGTVAVGGSDSVAAWRAYAFSQNGYVVRGGGAGAYAAVSGGATAVSSLAPSQRGRYRIDGITLSIAYDDGSQESRIIVTDPKDPKGAIWLDGVGYTRSP